MDSRYPVPIRNAVIIGEGNDGKGCLPHSCVSSKRKSLFDFKDILDVEATGIAKTFNDFSSIVIGIVINHNKFRKWIKVPSVLDQLMDTAMQFFGSI
jgi:hypothetical protein